MSAFLDRIASTASNSLAEYPEVLNYLINDRKLTRADLDKFGVGYCSNIVVRPESSKDFKVFEKDSSGFRSRQRKALFPIRACNGNTLGFSARRMGDSASVTDSGKPIPRYRNYVTDESKIVGGFFGITEAIPHILETGYVYVTEGAVDCISLAKVFPNTVSTLTSSINEAQMWALSMFAEQVVVVFDSDQPGKDGAQYVADRYGADKVKVRDISYHDCNTCLQTLGEEGFKNYMKRKLTFLKCRKVARR